MIPGQDAVSVPVTHTWRWVEPWYVAYGLLGAGVGGLAPIFLALTVSRTGSASYVGLVMAAFNLGGLGAPLWGGLADRYRLHRSLLAGGLVVTALGLAAFPLAATLTAWLGLALLQGAGSAAAATVANLLVVEAHPKAEWDQRIGWLQTFYGGGQVGGLLLAGALSADLRTGLLTAAGLTLLAFVPGWFMTRTPPRSSRPRPVLLQPTRHGEWVIGSPQRLYHHLGPKAWRRLGPMLLSPFGIFLFAWLMSFAGAAAVFSLYPVLMQQTYGVAPGLSSAGFAVAAGLGLALYSRAGGWADRFGPTGVMQAALGVRLLAFAGMFALGITHFGQGWLALLGFLLVVLAWSLLSVSGTALTAQLSPTNQGEAMGTFNAATALAGVIGAALGGWIAGRWGYNGASVMAMVGVAVGLAMTVAIRPVLPKDENVNPRA